MSLVIDNRGQAGPGVHALIVGISDYPHLAEGNKKPSGLPWRLTPPASSATSAFLLYDWLANRARLPLPLLTCRVLLAPSAKEQDDPRITVLASRCEADDFVAAGTDWRRDASRSGDEMTIFFFAGEALQVSLSEQLLLFQNFGSPVGPSMRGAVSFANLYNGMASAETAIAQQQVYFIFASGSSVTRSELGTRLYGTTDIFDVTPQIDRRLAPVFHFTALSMKLLSFFDVGIGASPLTQALIIKGLEGAAAIPVRTRQGTSAWGVTAASLAEWFSTQRNSVFRLTVDHVTSASFVISLVDQPPKVKVEVQIEPPHAAAASILDIEDSAGKEVFRLDSPASSQEIELPPGLYAFRVTPRQLESGLTTRRMLESVTPSGSTIRMDISDEGLE